MNKNSRVVFARCLARVIAAILAWVPFSVRAAPIAPDDREIAEFWHNAAVSFANIKSQDVEKVADMSETFIAAEMEATRYWGESRQEILELLARSDNWVVAQYARGAIARLKLRQTPIVMKFRALDGREVDLSQMRGKVVLIDFRGILHCKACELQEATLKPVYEKYHALGLEMITVCDDCPYPPNPKVDSMEKVRGLVTQYVAEHQLTWPTYFDGFGFTIFNRSQVDGTAPANPFFRQYNISGTPTYFLINKEGKLDGPDPSHAYIDYEIPGYLDGLVDALLHKK